jgi:hypothetical protein
MGCSCWIVTPSTTIPCRPHKRHARVFSARHNHFNEAHFNEAHFNEAHFNEAHFNEAHFNEASPCPALCPAGMRASLPAAVAATRRPHYGPPAKFLDESHALDRRTPEPHQP